MNGMFRAWSTPRAAEPDSGCGHGANTLERFDAWFTPGRFAAFLGLVIAANFFDVLLGTHSLFYRDFGLFGHPMAFYHRASFWRGEVPLWNPYSNCGLPFLAQWNTLVCYPGSLLYLLLPLPWSLNLFSLLHLLMAGVGMYWLAFAWTRLRLAACAAGIAYALNGLTLHCLIWPNNIAALAWMPLVVLFLERAKNEGGRWLFIAGLVGAMQMLTGAPEIIMFTWLVALLVLGGGGLTQRVAQPGKWRLFGAGWRRLLAVATMVFGLSAVQLLPFLNLLRHSQRDTGFADNAWAMPGWGWANFLVPLFHCTPSLAGVFSQDDQQWTSSYYLGIGIWVWAIMAVGSAFRVRQPRVGWLGITALLGLVLALGENSPVYGWLKFACPALGFIRFPIKFVVLAVWAVPLLGAYGLRAVLTHRGIAPSEAPKWGWVIGGALVSVIGLILYLALRYPVAGERWGDTCLSGFTRAAFLGGVVFCGLAMAKARSLGRAWSYAFALLVLLAGDVLSHAPRQNPTVAARELIGPGNPTEQGLPSGVGRAMLHPRAAILSQAGNPDPVEYVRGHRSITYPNWNLLEGVPLVNGFFSLYLREQRQVRQVLYADRAAYPGALADFLCVSRISSDRDLFSWRARPTALPFVTGGQQPVFLEERAMLERLRRNEFRPAQEVFFPKDVERLLPVTHPSRVRIGAMRMDSRSVWAEVEASSEAIVVVSQTYSDAWKAQVNGRRVPLWRANHAFQAVTVPAGRSEVRLIYEDRMYQWGAVISAVFLAGCLAGFVWKTRDPHELKERRPEAIE